VLNSPIEKILEFDFIKSIIAINNIELTVPGIK